MKRLYLLFVMTLGVSLPGALLAAQQQEPEAIAPIVDEKYGGASEIMALSPEKLAGILKDPESSVYARAKACQRLAVTGNRAAVPPLEALLSDARLSHYARFALEAIPDDSAGEALRRSLEKLEGKLLIGVINSVGRRQDEASLPLLAKLFHSSDREVAESAATAMRRIRPSY